MGTASPLISRGWHIAMRVTLLTDDSIGSALRGIIRQAQLGPLLRQSGDALGVAARHGLALRLTDDEALAELNSTFRKVSEPTDVLAFPGDGPHVGDIAISVGRAEAQALAAGTPPADELRMLAVHGLLHCLGHDHAEADEAARMTAATRELLPEQTIPDLVPHP